MTGTDRSTAAPAGFLRRARPQLGTLVEVGVRDERGAQAATCAAFARIAAIAATLSRFDPTSTIGRFNAAPAGAAFAVDDDARIVLAVAAALYRASAGLFDVSLGSGGAGWTCDGRVLRKLGDGVRLDLGGIAKGYAVDVAVSVLEARGVHRGWVNAGGDLRVFGALALPIDLRDEQGGGVRRFATLENGAFATSWIGAPATAAAAQGRHALGSGRSARHASVAAEECLWADALTKIVALSGDAAHPLLAAHGARAWLH